MISGYGWVMAHLFGYEVKFLHFIFVLKSVCFSKEWIEGFPYSVQRWTVTRKHECHDVGHSQTGVFLDVGFV